MSSCFWGIAFAGVVPVIWQSQAVAQTTKDDAVVHTNPDPQSHAATDAHITPRITPQFSIPVQIAAQVSARFALPQFILAAAGARRLVISLYFTRQFIALNRTAVAAAIKANNNTIKAVAQEQANAQWGMWAYMNLERCTVTSVATGSARCSESIWSILARPRQKGAG